jgi:hypothetical protein
MTKSKRFLRNMEKSALRRNGKFMPHPNPLPKGEGARRAGEAVVVLCLLGLAVPACKWRMRPTFPADRIAASLRHMCSTDYKLSVETRHQDKSLQAVVWKVGLFKGPSFDLQSMGKEALDTMDHVLLCATRIALSTDASLDFIEIKLADVLTGSTVTLWRYVPDVKDSMLQRIGDTEYFSRLVIEINVDKTIPPLKQIHRHGKTPAVTDLAASVRWDEPITMSEFLAKQIILRARREGAESLQAHADLSDPATLGVVIENWPSIQEEGPERAAKVTDLVHHSAQKVLEGYRFNGFRSMILRDGQGVALSSWKF